MNKIIENKSSIPLGKKKRKQPQYLIKEVIDGIPFFYTGYRKLLQRNTLETDFFLNISIRDFIKNYVGDKIKSQIDRAKYHVFIGAMGVQFDKENQFCHSIAVFDKTKLTPAKIGEKYAYVPADLVVEVDITIEAQDRLTNLFDEFVMRKVRRLFAFGTKKIVWVFTKSKSVIVATPDAPWQIMDWHHDIELFPGIIFNIEKYLQEEGINPDNA